MITTSLLLLPLLQPAQAARPAAKPPFAIASRTVPGLRPIAFAPNKSGSLVAMSLENNTIRIVNAATSQTVKTFTGHPQPAYALAWSHDGAYLASGDESARIFIWDVRTGNRIRTIYGMGHTRGIGKLSFNHPRTLLMSTGNDDAIFVWNVATGRKAGQVLGGGLNVYGAAFHPLSDNFTTGLLAGGARTYRVTPQGPKLTGTLTFVNPGGQPHGVFDAVWSPDGTRILTAGNDQNAVVWDVKGLKRLAVLRGHQDFVRKVAISPNGRYYVTSSSDRTIKIWDARTYQNIVTVENQSSVSSPLAFTGDGRYLLTTNTEDQLMIHQLTPPLAAAATTKPAPTRRRRGRG